jgi:hypothetical protein
MIDREKESIIREPELSSMALVRAAVALSLDRMWALLRGYPTI